MARLANQDAVQSKLRSGDGGLPTLVNGRLEMALDDRLKALFSQYV